MKVLFLTRDRGTASHHRVGQYLSALARQGVVFRVLPYRLDAGEGRIAALRRILRRLAGVVAARGFDLVWVDEAPFPELPPGPAAAASRLLPARCIFDAWAGEAPPESLRGLKSVTWVTGEVDTLENRTSFRLPWSVAACGEEGVAETRPPVLGLAGSGDVAVHLEAARPALERLEPHAFSLAVQAPVRSRTAFAVRTEPLPFSPCHGPPCSWQLAYLPERSPGPHAALDELNILKCMTLGIPVVTGAGGEIARLVEDAGIGYAAETPTEQHHFLARLLASADLRTRLGTNGRAWVGRERARSLIAPRMVRLLAQAAGTTAPE